MPSSWLPRAYERAAPTRGHCWSRPGPGLSAGGRQQLGRRTGAKFRRSADRPARIAQPLRDLLRVGASPAHRLRQRGGTQVNGQLVAGRQMLRSGDVLRVGQTELRFESETSGILSAAGTPMPETVSQRAAQLHAFAEPQDTPAPVHSSFDDLLFRLRTGDEAAANQIYRRFSQRLIALAQARLGEAVRRKVDPEEVVLSAYKSFFIRFADGRFQVANWASLWGLLTGITLRKCGKQFEYYHADKRDVAKEVRIRLSPDESAAGWEAIARAHAVGSRRFGGHGGAVDADLKSATSRNCSPRPPELHGRGDQPASRLLPTHRPPRAPRGEDLAGAAPAGIRSRRVGTLRILTAPSQQPPASAPEILAHPVHVGPPEPGGSEAHGRQAVPQFEHLARIM